MITDQQITIASGVQALTPPNPFTISDVSHVWIVCDVYENDLAQVHLGEYADIRLNAYPDRVLQGRISNIGQIMDPNLRTAKVRLEVENPGLMRFGMFVTATFHGDDHGNARHRAGHRHPASARPRLGLRAARRRAVSSASKWPAAAMLPGNMQEIVSGIKPGDQVVANALVLQNTVEQ